MSELNAAAAAPLEVLNLNALQILLVHAPNLLTTRDLGRLSVCSKTLSRITDDSEVWKRIFDKAVAVGESCIVDDGHKKYPRTEPITWNGEPGLLKCFANPSPQILDKVGYKHAAGCLLSKTCFHCGTMSGEANPLTMTRICRACTDLQESSWAITKSKAKEAFLLTDNDFVACALSSASYPFGFFRKMKGTTVLFLMSDVVAASSAKWGGPDGLESEITKRKAAAVKRYGTRKSSSKSKKRRPKIESLSSRSGDDLLSLRISLSPTLPIPVPILWCMELKMTHCVKCPACDVRGTTFDIALHEILEHGGSLTNRETVASSPTKSPGTIPESIHPAEELVTLLERAEVNYNELRFGRSTCHFTLDDCKVAVYLAHRTGKLIISYQPRQNTVPVVLCQTGLGEAAELATEAETFFFDKLKEALNLRETRSEQLLAALVSRAIPRLNSNTVNTDGWQGNYLKTPVLCSAWDILGLL